MHRGNDEVEDTPIKDKFSEYPNLLSQWYYILHVC